MNRLFKRLFKRISLLRYRYHNYLYWRSKKPGLSMKDAWEKADLTL